MNRTSVSRDEKMGQTDVGSKKSALQNEYSTGIDDSEGVAIIGGFSQDRPLPNDGIGFHFEPAGNVLDAEPFNTKSVRVLTTKLFLAFGSFDLYSVAEEKWSVERPDSILGTVTVFHYLDTDENCASNGASTVQSKISAFDRGVSS